MKLHNPRANAPLDRRSVYWFRAVHALALVAIVYMLTVPQSTTTVWMAIGLFFVRHLSITVGAHRLYSHKAFRVVHPFWEYVVVILFAGCFQNDAHWWAGMHRRHHAFSDTEKDPYTVLMGFKWAHMAWIPRASRELEPGEAQDLADNPVIQWQKKWYLPVAIAVAFIVPTALASTWGDPLGGFLVAGWLCLFAQYHLTWCINSVAHKWGWYRYHRSGTARANWWLGLPTVGEGSSHDRHHLAQTDYRIDPRWWALDVGKWFIWIFSKIGIFYDLQRVPEEKVWARAERSHVA